eukprot:c3295_g1_i2.p1 GENE.c3295_g1_i2~~c3295_g1_i2.p1  ORF type:complete len:263 (-),score=54.93 c3295_g1_i2:4-681(-)
MSNPLDMLAALVEEQYHNSVSAYIFRTFAGLTVPTFISILCENTPKTLSKIGYFCCLSTIAAAVCVPLFLHFNKALSYSASGLHMFVSVVASLTVLFTLQDKPGLCFLVYVLVTLFMMLVYPFFPKYRNHIFLGIVFMFNWIALIALGIDAIGVFFTTPIKFFELAHVNMLTTCIFLDHLIVAISISLMPMVPLSFAVFHLFVPPMLPLFLTIRERGFGFVRLTE